MKKSLGDILVEEGKLSTQDLNKALAYQMRQVLGRDPGDVTEFLLEIARTKYNNRDRYYLGRILTELKLLPEQDVRDALETQKASPAEKPRSRLDALKLVMEQINSSYNLIELLHQILVLAAQLVEAESASIVIYDHTRDSLVIVMPMGPGADAVRDREVPRTRGIVGWVYNKGRSAISNDATNDRRFFADIDESSGYRSRQILCVPLTVNGKRLGAIEVINKIPIAEHRPRVFSPADQFLLEMLSAQAAVAIENTRLAAALTQAEEDLTRHATDVAEEQKAHAGALVAGSLREEMRKSLTPLQGYASRMAERIDDEKVRKYQRFIDRELSRLIARADTFTRYLDRTLQPEHLPVSLAELLKELETRTWVECRTCGISFQREMKGDITLNADAGLLLTALEQIFRNSREAMAEGGTFSVQVSLKGRKALFEVTDTGKGFDTDAIEKALEPFHTRGKPHGAGLGLPIARRIVELHGGTLQVSNREPGPGAVVSFTLPVD
jgi:signal transduction histidine kinase